MAFELLQKNYVQALLFILLTILCIFVFKPKNVDNTWVMAGGFFIGFMLVNAIFIWMAPHRWHYFFYSLGISVLYLVSISIIVPAMIKLLKIEGSAESAMIFIFIIYHPVLLLFILTLKWFYLKFS